MPKNSGDQTSPGLTVYRALHLPTDAKVNWKTVCGTHIHIFRHFCRRVKPNAFRTALTHIPDSLRPHSLTHSHFQTEHSNYCKTKLFFLVRQEENRLLFLFVNRNFTGTDVLCQDWLGIGLSQILLLFMIR